MAPPLMIHHHIHGKDRHDLCIYLAERLIVRSGHELRDGTWFKKKHIYAGEPDIYVRVADVFKNGRGQRLDKQNFYVVEIESDLTKENKLKKWAQFRETVKDTELIIVNLAEYTGDLDDWRGLEKFIASQLPFVEAS